MGWYESDDDDFHVPWYSRVREPIEDGSRSSRVATVDMTMEQASRLAELLRPMGMDLKQVSDVRMTSGTIKASVTAAVAPKPVPPRKELFLQAITLCAEEAIALGASAQELRHALYAGLGLGDD